MYSTALKDFKTVRSGSAHHHTEAESGGSLSTGGWPDLHIEFQLSQNYIERPGPQNKIHI